MPRPVQPLGTYGEITVTKAGGVYCARTRYRGFDGAYRRFQARDRARQSAVNTLKAKIAAYVESGPGEDLTAQSKLSEVAELWLEEAALRGKLTGQSLDGYRDSVYDVVLPALGNLRLGELTVGTLDRFLKAVARSVPSRAQRARVVLSQILDLAVRHDALQINPVKGLNRSGAELSAHRTIQHEADRYTSIVQLAAEYDTIATTAQTHRWQQLLHQAGLDDQQVAAIIASDAYGPLAATLRRAEADGHRPGQLLSRVVTQHDLGDADDLAAVLHHRIRVASARPPVTNGSNGGRGTRPVRIAGLIPAATGAMTDQHRRALAERQQLIESRATKLLHQALRQQRTPWLRALGTPPRDPHHRRTWMRHARTVAAYRDCYQVTDSQRPLGTQPDSQAQQADAHHATIAINHARHTATVDRGGPSTRPGRDATARHGTERPGL